MLCFKLECPFGWVNGGSDSVGCLYFHTTETMSWENAKLYCQNKRQGSHLVEIFDADQQTLVKQKTIENGIGKRWWIGLSDKEQETTYKWAYSNQIATYFAWGPSEPGNTDSNSNDAYDEIALWSSPDYYWADISNGYVNNMYALCQYHPLSDLTRSGNENWNKNHNDGNGIKYNLLLILSALMYNFMPVNYPF